MPTDVADLPEQRRHPWNPIQVSLVVISKRARRASDDLARDAVARAVRVLLVVLGVLIVIAGILLSPLPGPGGLPVVVVGLMIVLRNSFKARRQFVRFQHAHPKMIFPIRRLLRRDPQVVSMFWQQVLRVERLVLPRRMRFAVRSRRRFRRRPGVA